MTGARGIQRYPDRREWRLPGRPMDSFKIGSYRISTRLQRLDDTSRFERLLELEGEPVAHGYISRAVLAFNSYVPPPWRSPVVGYLTFSSSSIDWITIAAWMDLGEFDHYYRLLHGEKPVYFHYQRQRTGTFQSGYLTKVGLGTRAEPVGEGLSESSYEFALVTPDLEALLKQGAT